MKLFVIGISGITGGGKTTLAASLLEFLNNATNEKLFNGYHINSVQLIQQDKYFYARDSPHHKWIPEINFINRELLSAMDMDRFACDVEVLQSKLSESIPENSKITSSKEINCSSVAYNDNSVPLNILIIEGFLIFNDERINRWCHIRLHIYLSYDVGYERRLTRTFKHINPNPKWYFANFIWPSYQMNLNEIKTKMDLNFIDGEQSVQDIFDQSLKLIGKSLENQTTE